MSKTFLVRHGVFGALNDILSGSYKPYYRKYSYRNGKISVSVIAKIAVNITGDSLGNVAASTAAYYMTMMIFLNHPNAKYNGIHSFTNCSRKISCSAANLRGHFTEATGCITLKYIKIVLTAVKDNVLVNYCDTFKFLYSAGSNASLKYKLNI